MQNCTFIDTQILGYLKKKILVLWVQVNEDCYSSYTVILQTLEVNKSTSVSMPLIILKNQRAEKEKNLQATAVSDEDFTTSVKSGIDALGSGNPMTIQTSGALPGTITVQGGQYEVSLLSHSQGALILSSWRLGG